MTEERFDEIADTVVDVVAVVSAAALFAVVAFAFSRAGAAPASGIAAMFGGAYMVGRHHSTRSWSQVIKMTVDGVFIGILMAGEDEVPDGEAAMSYANHLVELAERFLEIAKEGRAKVIMCSSKGGSA